MDSIGGASNASHGSHVLADAVHMASTGSASETKAATHGQHAAVEETLELLPADDVRHAIVAEQQVAALCALVLSCATVATQAEEGPGGPV